MAKILVEDREENTKVPFLRGILIRSLQDAGLSFKEAYRLASEIRSDLGDVPSVTTDELRRQVLRRLRTLKGELVVNRYEEHNLPFTIMVEQRDGTLSPFSRLEYQHCLETIGLESGESAAFVAMLHKHLIDRHIQRLQSRHLARLTYRYLRQSHNLGPAVAHRWLVWRDFVNSGRPLIFLLGGTAGCGKSTTATMLPRHRAYPVDRHAARSHAHHDPEAADAGVAHLVLCRLERPARSAGKYRGGTGHTAHPRLPQPG